MATLATASRTNVVVGEHRYSDFMQAPIRRLDGREGNNVQGAKLGMTLGAVMTLAFMVGQLWPGISCYLRLRYFREPCECVFHVDGSARGAPDWWTDRAFCRVTEVVECRRICAQSSELNRALRCLLAFLTGDLDYFI